MNHVLATQFQYNMFQRCFSGIQVVSHIISYFFWVERVKPPSGTGRKDQPVQSQAKTTSKEGNSTPEGDTSSEREARGLETVTIGLRSKRLPPAWTLAEINGDNSECGGFD